MKKTKEQRERLDAYKQVAGEYGFSLDHNAAEPDDDFIVLRASGNKSLKLHISSTDWIWFDQDHEKEAHGKGLDQLRTWLKQSKIAKRLNNKKAEIPFVVNSKLANFVDESTISSHWGGERVLFVAMTFGLAKQISRIISTKGDEKSAMFKLAAALEEETTN